MLQSISWLQFGGFIFISLVGYYGYVVYRFYGREVLGLVARWKDGKDIIAGEPVAAEQEVRYGPGLPGEGQGVMFEPTAAEEPKPEMFKVMEKVVALLRAVLNEGAATGVRREELEDRIQQVLVKYRHLLRTPYGRTINHFITRACMTQFSLALTAEDVQRLWGVD